MGTRAYRERERWELDSQSPYNSKIRIGGVVPDNVDVMVPAGVGGEKVYAERSPDNIVVIKTKLERCEEDVF